MCTLTCISIISYKQDNKDDDKILINNFITSPYIRTDKITDIKREVKSLKKAESKN